MTINKIYTFLHIYITNNNDQWKKVFHECINSIIYSGLYKTSSKIILGINVSDKLKKEGLEYINQNIKYLFKIEIKAINNEEYSTEWTTLQLVYNYRNQYDACIYFHTKNASRNIYDNRYDLNEQARFVMISQVIYKHKDNLRYIEMGYDIIGCNWRLENHFSGNFWVSSAEHIRKLPNPNDLFENEEIKNKYLTKEYAGWSYDGINQQGWEKEYLRYVAETWISFTEKKPNYLDLITLINHNNNLSNLENYI